MDQSSGPFTDSQKPAGRLRLWELRKSGAGLGPLTFEDYRDAAWAMKEGLMKDDPGNGTDRRVYRPPELVVISLRPEEAVLGNCKTMTSAGPVSGSCASLGSCHTVGS
jgi:hypothetical protein